MPRQGSPKAYLLVEGKDDKHVITHVCMRHDLPTIELREPNEGDIGSGIDELLAGIPQRLREPHVRTIGIVVDTDDDLAARWQALRSRILAADYRSIPKEPVAEGWISTETTLKRVGIWLMPDNLLPGMLEDFVVQLIPVGDELILKAEAIVAEIESEALNHYPKVQHPKALIHTWLAWQETPGQPMGLAIRAQTLRHDSPTALAFVAWLRRLFEIPPASEVA